MDDLGARRTRRWWQTGHPIRSIGRAGAFIDDVGFALLFPASGVALPSLYEAASEQPMPLSETAWGPDEQRVWGWKDELPRTGLAWSGRLLGGGRASLLAPDVLADCYPGAGEPDGRWTRPELRVWGGAPRPESNRRPHPYHSCCRTPVIEGAKVRGP